MSSIKRALDSAEPEVAPEESANQPATSTSATSDNKRFRSKTYGLFDNSLDVSDYYIDEDSGLRKVFPYKFTFQSFCKGRWIGRKITELFTSEFRAATPEIVASRCKKGLLKVNGQIVDPEYILQDNDLITNQIHRHEFPVLASPIPIVHMDDDILVIDKPPSLPVHPCGKFRLNSITAILEKENNIKDIHVVHRLDRLTSGVMIMGRTKAKAQKLHEAMRNREMHKEYLCRVEGEFPDGVIECDQPLETISHKIGICIVSPKGKASKTVFERLNFNGKSSTVLCKPLTGRMHQIRVHLQYLGYPIVNDTFYNNPVFGPNKGKNGDYGKSLEELVKAVDEDHQQSKFLERSDGNNEELLKSERNQMAIKALEHYTSQASWAEIKKSYVYDPAKETRDDDCQDCSAPIFCNPTPSEQFIYLHALRYKAQDWNYETQVPIWAKSDWTFD